jgi:hypothetical protein
VTDRPLANGAACRVLLSSLSESHPVIPGRFLFNKQSKISDYATVNGVFDTPVPYQISATPIKQADTWLAKFCSEASGAILKANGSYDMQFTHSCIA